MTNPSRRPARRGGWCPGWAAAALALLAGAAGGQQPAPLQDCLCVTNGHSALVGFDVVFDGGKPMDSSLQPRYRAWFCRAVANPAQEPVNAHVLLAQDPAQPQQRTRYNAPVQRTPDRNCDTIGPRSQFTIAPQPDGQRLLLQVRESTPPPDQLDAEAWQRHRARLSPEGVRSATHGYEAARICRHLLAEQSRQVAALRQRQPGDATPLQVERTRLHALTQAVATLDLACKDQPEYRLREPLLARVERSLLACRALGGSEADCEPGAAW